MNIVPTLKVLMKLGMTQDEAYNLIGRGPDVLMRFLRYRCESWTQMIELYEEAENDVHHC